MSDAAAPSGVDGGTLYDALQSISVEDAAPDDASAPVDAAPTAETSEVSVDERAEAAPADSGTSAPDPFESYLAELEAEPPDEDAIEDAEALKELGENPNSRARKRIQQLAGRTKEAEAKAAQYEAQLAQMQETMSKQARLLQAKLAAQQSERQVRPPVAPQPQAHGEQNPFDELMGHLAPRFEAELDRRVAPLQQKLDAYERREAEMRQQAQFAQQVQAIEQEAASVRHMLVPGLPDEMLQSPEIASALDELLITKAVAENKPVSEVIPSTRKALAQVARAMTQAARHRGKQLVERPEVPAPGESGVAAKQSNGVPLYSSEQLLKAGYRGTMDAFRDGWSKLKGTEPADGWS